MPEAEREEADLADEQPPERLTLGEFGVVIVAIALVIYWVGTSLDFSSFLRGLRTVAPILTGLGGVGTVILAYLYLQQRDVLREQAEIQKRQTSIMEASHRPIVEVEDWNVEGRQLIAHISNYGNGVATDLELVTLPVYTEDAPLESVVTTNRLTRRAQNPEAHRQGRSITAGEEDIEFATYPSIAIRREGNPDSATTECAFREGVGMMGREGVDVVRIHFFVRYRDILDDLRVQRLKSLELEPNGEFMNIEEWSKHAGYITWGIPTISPDDLSFDLSEAERGTDRTVV